MAIAGAGITSGQAPGLAGAAAAAGPAIGFADDATKYADDGGEALFAEMNKLGATTNRVAVFWDANAPTTIEDKPFLDRMIPVAQRHHIQIVFDVYPVKATMAPTTQDAANQFCDYAVHVMKTYPYVRKVIIGNEPNQPRFWQPIWTPDGKPASPAAMEVVLASCYDKLKAFDSSLDVIGVGLSERGNDDPHATSNSSISPVRWIKALGEAYRASGRTKPLFDEWSWHCYPNVNTDEIELGYQWPNTGCVNAARVKLALWDAFNGTAQPTLPGPYPISTTGQTLFGNTIRMFIDETGWQVDTRNRPGYFNAENVPTIDEGKQAHDYEKLVHLANCEPTLTGFLIRPEVDQADRRGFQSGVLRVTGEERPSAADPSESVKHAIAADGGACTSPFWAKYGSFWFSNTAVAPLYDREGEGQMPYVTKHALASIVKSGGGTYVSMQAGEGFTYTLKFAEGKKTATVRGSAPKTFATAKMPNSFLRGTVVVKLSAETNANRTSSVTFDWTGRKWSVAASAASPPTGSVTGTVLVNGRSFTGGPIPYGSTIDVTSGTLTMTADVGTLAVSGNGTIPAKAMLTRTSERVKKIKRPFIQLTLVGGDFSVCSGRALATTARKKKPVRLLWAKGKGRFRSEGRDSITSVHGTYWLTEDRCDGTLTVVKDGVVKVRDLRKHKTVTVRAGQSYLALHRPGH